MKSILAALLLMASLGGCAQAGVATSAPTAQAADEPTPEIVTQEPAESVEPDAEPTATEDATPKRFKPGEPITVTQDGEDWATVTIDRVKLVKRYEGGYYDDVPAKGNVYVQLRVTYVALQNGVDYNPFDWQIFVGGEAAGDYTFVSNGPKPALESGTLPKGRKASGYLVYEVAAKGEILFSYKGNAFSNDAPIFEVVLRA